MLLNMATSISSSCPIYGIAKSIPDLMANRVDLAVGAISSLLPLVRMGALKALAVTSPQRSSLAPDIPTSAEAGLPDLRIQGAIFTMATGGTPPPIVSTAGSRAIAKAAALPQVHDAFAKQGIEDFHMGPQDLGRFFQAEAARYSSLLKHSRVTATSR